ncbi:hypothetical protein [Thermococcus sp. GR6]|uniref:hypothetical protein n=1 Tax=Thermococcus sp. GR6 TaxID=1638256 RepID=UPI00197E19FF|nr:hypothetical protein [Thermococcus sp. GR6]
MCGRNDKRRKPRQGSTTYFLLSSENPENVEVINETETELLDPYTAFKQYTVRVLGNGTLDVVFKYGSGCPYGTEERVTIGFYIGLPPEDINLTVTNPEEVLNITTLNITDIVEEVNLVDRYFVVEGADDSGEG